MQTPLLCQHRRFVDGTLDAVTPITCRKVVDDETYEVEMGRIRAAEAELARRERAKEISTANTVCHFVFCFFFG